MVRNKWLSVLLTALLTAGPGLTWAQAQGTASSGPGGGEAVAAGFSNALYVPGKAIVCGASGVLWFSIMAITFGHLYDEAFKFVKGGCGGKWIVTAEDIKRADP